MPNSLGNLTQIAQRAFLESLAESTEDYARACEVLTFEGGQARIMAANAGGLATEITGGTTSLAATDLTSGISVVTQRGWAHKHRLPRAELAWLNPESVGSIATQLANAAAQNINKLFFDGLEGLFSLAHPMAGAGAGQVGAGKKFVDTGLAYLQTEAGAGTNSNKLTDALSQNALDAARQALRNYRNQRGVPMNMSGSNRNALVVAPKNERLARQLVGSQFTSDQLQLNTFAGFADVVVFPFTTDDDDWFLIDVAKSPCGIWMGEAPMIEVLPSEDNVFVNFVAQFSASFYVKAYEYGIIGSNVA